MKIILSLHKTIFSKSNTFFEKAFFQVNVITFYYVHKGSFYKNSNLLEDSAISHTKVV